MNINLPFFICFLILQTFVYAQDKGNPLSYRIFDAKGKTTNYEDMLGQLKNADIVFFGELHNNPICHWLQLELARDLFSRKKARLLLGAEMFETDNQILINEYFLGHINEKNFESEARLWGNYRTDYKPLLDFAKDNELRFVATNVPRRYASQVSREGLLALNGLPEYSKIYIAPLPIFEDLDLGCYKQMLEMSEGNAKFPQAQMLKDATMASSILRNWQKGDLMLHFNGAFHSDNREGIIWYIRKQNPHLNIMVISTVEQDEVEKLDPEHYQKGNYILCTPNRMTKTH